MSAETPKNSALLHVASPRACNAQQMDEMSTPDATTDATSVQQVDIKALANAAISALECNKPCNNDATTLEKPCNKCASKDTPFVALKSAPVAQPKLVQKSVPVAEKPRQFAPPVKTSKAELVVLSDSDIAPLVPVIRRLRPLVDSWSLAKHINPDVVTYFAEIPESTHAELIDDAIAKLRHHKPHKPSSDNPTWIRFLSMARHHGVLPEEVEAEFTEQDIEDLCEGPAEHLEKHMATLADYIIRHRKPLPIGHPEDNTPEVPCRLCVHLLPSLVNPTGGLAQCTKHFDLPLTVPTVRRRCQDFHLT